MDNEVRCRTAPRAMPHELALPPAVIGHRRLAQSLPSRSPTTTHTSKHVVAATGSCLIYPQKCVVDYLNGRRQMAAMFWNLDRLGDWFPVRIIRYLPSLTGSSLFYVEEETIDGRVLGFPLRLKSRVEERQTRCQPLHNLFTVLHSALTNRTIKPKPTAL